MKILVLMVSIILCATYVSFVYMMFAIKYVKQNLWRNFAALLWLQYKGVLHITLYAVINILH
jgi:hypothetical protein